MSKLVASQHDGVFKSDLYEHADGSVTRALTQPSEKLILQRNAELRKHDGQKDLTFGRQVASIPMNDFEMLCRKYPELRGGDSEQRARRLHKILSSTEGKKYLVRESL